MDAKITRLGFLAALESSDATVCHRMTYDRLGRLIQSDGLTRNVDAKGRVLQESFPGGYLIETAYDSQGRKISCSVPSADCLIEYGYHVKDLTSVASKTISGKRFYEHYYGSRDLFGNLLEEDRIDSGATRYSFDLSSRRRAIESLFVQEVKYDAVGNIIWMKTRGDESEYLYNPLYQLTAETGLFAHTYACDALDHRRQKDHEVDL